ncbi:hypothetical protein ACFQ1E_01425 [Sphingomonas canadensis]|uniref:Lipoprotein n=1 Tax=Sphingomonas canadensis TaxID=1219257 RepID=A0ABW3H6G4_9SPHN|nr:hypothetical protein [Sphingomonas canadensis]MCW3835098.1 hypothetical protein [Sphingomonas canadensis]
MIRRVAWIAAAAAALAGCSLIGSKPAEPDTLAKWVAAHARLPGDISTVVGTGEGMKAAKTADGNGIVLTSTDPKSTTPELRYYFVPLSEVDAKLDADLRKAIFPGGTATFAPDGDKPARKLSESELETLYLSFIVAKDVALCEGLTKPCDAAVLAAVVGKLKGAPLSGKGSRSFMVTAAPDPEKVMGDEAGDVQALCGFDPKRDRMPSHVAQGCQNLRRMAWAIDRGFTLSEKGDLVALTPEALKRQLDTLARGPVYRDGNLDGAITEEN